MKSAIHKLHKEFSSFSIPLRVKSDNDSPFNCGNLDKNMQNI